MGLQSIHLVTKLAADIYCLHRLSDCPLSRVVSAPRNSNRMGTFFGNGSERVLNSFISKMLPVPDALLGAFGYVLDVVTGVIGARIVGKRNHGSLSYSVLQLVHESFWRLIYKTLDDRPD